MVCENKLLSKINEINKELAESKLLLMDIPTIQKGIDWCKKWHDGQFRQSGEAYYFHPIAVAYYCLDYNPQTHIGVNCPTPLKGTLRNNFY